MPKSLIEVFQLTPAIGAELFGVDLTRPFSHEVQERIYELLIEHQVVFFRDQSLNPERQLELAKSFGDPEPPHPV